MYVLIVLNCHHFRNLGRNHSEESGHLSVLFRQSEQTNYFFRNYTRRKLFFY